MRSLVVCATVEEGQHQQRHDDMHVAKSERDAVLAIVAKSGLLLRNAPEHLKLDKDVVLAAVTQSGFALQWAGSSLKGNREVVQAAVGQTGVALEFASAELRADKDLALAAVQQDGNALEYVSEDLLADTEVVLAAVIQDGRALQWASDDLISDTDFMRRVMHVTPASLRSYIICNITMLSGRSTVITRREDRKVHTKNCMLSICAQRLGLDGETVRSQGDLLLGEHSLPESSCDWRLKAGKIHELTLIVAVRKPGEDGQQDIALNIGGEEDDFYDDVEEDDEHNRNEEYDMLWEQWLAPSVNLDHYG
mmetsp:Transcript_25331/g.58867  ORF Transcript_25331/g.58867 Transcript_25331/m.58867 type:complete len:308 (-) Transcript_25331:89-1012(-)|eukprot:CAMPEP_0178436926 /NCGR_PEP_ID=MMETSP0689_2-20121128/34699_1 /TAXON_ID=160604 /ORGANISM="Amphidinium massartii, Strain CS-259" /LENGTH=307 /DNA_ID=CAMNT_0020059053 /DNA_START=64 /DNA_END=987 /DNA_ORIENTATION=-